VAGLKVKFRFTPREVRRAQVKKRREEKRREEKSAKFENS